MGRLPPEPVQLAWSLPGGRPGGPGRPVASSSPLPHQIPVAVEVRICELRRRHPDWGPRRLHHELGRDGVQPLPSRSAIYRTLIRHQLIEPVTRRRRRADYRRWERDRPMELWQLDVMGGVWLTNGRELKVVTGLDDHSRFCVMAGLVERANAAASARSCRRPGAVRDP